MKEAVAIAKKAVKADGVMLGGGKLEIKCKAGAAWMITPENHVAPPALIKETAETSRRSVRMGEGAAILSRADDPST